MEHVRLLLNSIRHGEDQGCYKKILFIDFLQFTQAMVQVTVISYCENMSG